MSDKPQVAPSNFPLDSALYYECHITIEPVFGLRLAEADNIAKKYQFRLANLLMQKREEDTAERSKYDTFMTSTNMKFGELESNMIALIYELQEEGFKVWRYKIEDTICDSKFKDIYNLVGKGVENGTKTTVA